MNTGLRRFSMQPFYVDEGEFFAWIGNEGKGEVSELVCLEIFPEFTDAPVLEGFDGVEGDVPFGREVC